MNKNEILGIGIVAIAIALMIGGTIAVVPAVAQDSQSSTIEDSDSNTQSNEVTVNQTAQIGEPIPDCAPQACIDIEQSADVTLENTVEDNDEFNNEQTFRKVPEERP
jgi:hypothetical protein